MSLFERLGGAAALGALIDDLSRRLLADPQLGHYFEDIDGETLQAHREAYLTAVLGGPEAYEGRGMRESHRPFSITDADMDRFIALAAESLRAADVAEPDAREVLDYFERLRPAIVAPEPRIGTTNLTPPTA